MKKQTKLEKPGFNLPKCYFSFKFYFRKLEYNKSREERCNIFLGTIRRYF